MCWIIGWANWPQSPYLSSGTLEPQCPASYASIIEEKVLLRKWGGPWGCTSCASSRREWHQDCPTPMSSLICLRLRPTHALTHHGSSALCPCCFCDRDMQTRVDSEPADTALSHLPSFPSQSQGKTEKETWGAARISPVLPDPKDLNVKQMGPRHSSKTHAVPFCNFDTSFGHICLFFSKHSCAHKLGTKVHRQKPSLEMFCLPLREDEREFSHLTNG